MYLYEAKRVKFLSASNNKEIKKVSVNHMGLIVWHLFVAAFIPPVRQKSF